MINSDPPLRRDKIRVVGGCAGSPLLFARAAYVCICVCSGAFAVAYVRRHGGPYIRAHVAGRYPEVRGQKVKHEHVHRAPYCCSTYVRRIIRACERSHEEQVVGGRGSVRRRAWCERLNTRVAQAWASGTYRSECGGRVIRSDSLLEFRQGVALHCRGPHKKGRDTHERCHPEDVGQRLLHCRLHRALAESRVDHAVERDEQDGREARADNHTEEGRRC